MTLDELLERGLGAAAQDYAARRVQMDRPIRETNVPMPERTIAPESNAPRP